MPASCVTLQTLHDLGIKCSRKRSGLLEYSSKGSDVILLYDGVKDEWWSTIPGVLPMMVLSAKEAMRVAKEFLV